jgi:hypothetical protein
MPEARTVPEAQELICFNRAPRAISRHSFAVLFRQALVGDLEGARWMR